MIERSITFENDKKPTVNELRELLMDYLNGAATVYTQGEEWTITLPGNVSAFVREVAPEARIKPTRINAGGMREIELVISKGKLLVTTDADWFTEVVADGLVKAIKDRWS